MISILKGWFASAWVFRASSRQYKNSSMAWAITLPFVLIVLLSVGSIGQLVFHQGVEATDFLAGQLASAVSNRTIEQLENWVQKAPMLNKLNQAAVAQGSLNLKDLDSVERQLSSQLQTFSELAQLIVVDTQGRSVTVTRQGEKPYKVKKISPLPGPALADQGLQQMPWYKQAVKTGQKTWYKEFKQGRAIAVLPILDLRKQVQQVLASALDLSQMDPFLDKLRLIPKEPGKGPSLTPKGQVFVADTSDKNNRIGLLLGTSTDEVPYQRNDQGQMTGMLARNSSDPITQEVIAWLEPRLNKIPLDDDAQADDAQTDDAQTFKGRFYFGGVKPVKAAGEVKEVKAIKGDWLHIQARRHQPYVGAEWLIVTVVPQADVRGPIQSKQYKTLLLCLLLLLMSLLLCAAIARHLIRPVRRLSHAAQALSQGNWNVALPLDRQDELGELAQSFAVMSQELQRSFRQLEKRNQTLQTQKERLEELDRLKDEFLANTSHELRTPLSGILGLAESLQIQTLEPLQPKQGEVIGWIIQSARRLSILVDDILDLSKLENHALRLNFGSINLQTLAQHVFVLCQPLAAPHRLHLVNQISPTLPLAYGDLQRVQQIFYNLIGNAIKFTNEGKITVAAQLLPQAIAITVTDTGIGMESEIQHRIFNAFEQGKGEITRMYGGTGLGLSICKSLVELQGGHLKLVRSHPGQGSQFQFTLPIFNPKIHGPQQCEPLLSAPPALPRPIAAHRPNKNASWNHEQRNPEAHSQNTQPSSRPAPKAKARILVVDDDPMNLHILQEQLAESYEVVLAETGEQALQHLDPRQADIESFDLVILDVMMPLLSGYEVCRRLRQDYPMYRLPVIMLTARVQVEDVIAGFDAEANDYLKKPFSREELRKRVETHLSHRLYGRFVPEHFLKFLQKSSIVDIALGNQVSRFMTVMFSDIRGFATLSESMSPQENFDFVNDYLQRVSPEIRSHAGFIVKYLGDGMMAIFPECPADAIAAAIAKLRQVQRLNRDRAPLPSLQIGIGIHFDEMKVGIVGESKRMQGDAFSDGVNLTARLEGLTKFYRVSILISEQVVEQLGSNPPFFLRRLDKVAVVGRLKPLTIYEVFDADPKAIRDHKLQTRDRFEAGITCYQAAQFVEAQLHFQAVLAENPDDFPAQLYCRWVSDLLENPPTGGWEGISNWGQK